MNGPILSILICHLPERKDLLMRLLKNINMHGGFDERIEIQVHDGVGITTGRKRNELLAMANGRYVAFVDDDDLITKDYFPGVFEGILKGVDCCSLKGIITDDGKNPRTFEHSITHDRYETVKRDGKDYFLRYPNHLNVIKTSIARDIGFPDQTISEDSEFARKLHHSGLLKTEHWIEEVIYLYEFRKK